MTLGEFIVGVHDAWSAPGAGAMVKLALDTGLVAFQAPGLNNAPPEKARVNIAPPPRERFVNFI